MMSSQNLAIRFEEQLAKASDFSNYDFFTHAQALSAIQIIVQQTSLELMRRLKSNERLDDLFLLLTCMDKALTEAIKTIPQMYLPPIAVNASSVGILLFMVEHATDPVTTDDPS